MVPGSQRVEVDGEVFEVTIGARQANFTWVSGPNPGYGFSSAGSAPGHTLTADELISRIRDFLGNINPKTGHLD